tara:strand:+ start:208 stop:603 length:396 start_codon:yes stop_codon:yes gene_type:complete
MLLLLLFSCDDGSTYIIGYYPPSSELVCNEDDGYEKYFIDINPLHSIYHNYEIDWKVTNGVIVLLRGSIYDTEICLKKNTSYSLYNYSTYSWYDEEETDYQWRLYDENSEYILGFTFTGTNSYTHVFIIED